MFETTWRWILCDKDGTANFDKVCARRYSSLIFELNNDNILVLEIAEKRGYADVDMLINDLKWTEDRAQSNLTTLMNEGICWIDEQSTPHSYWISGLYF